MEKYEKPCMEVVEIEEEVVIGTCCDTAGDAQS